MIPPTTTPTLSTQTLVRPALSRPATNLGKIVDGGWHQVGVTWDYEAHTLRYWVAMENSAERSTGDIATQYLGGQTTAYVGFTGATGGADGSPTGAGCRSRCLLCRYQQRPRQH